VRDNLLAASLSWLSNMQSIERQFRTKPPYVPCYLSCTGLYAYSFENQDINKTRCELIGALLTRSLFWGNHRAFWGLDSRSTAHGSLLGGDDTRSSSLQSIYALIMWFIVLSTWIGVSKKPESRRYSAQMLNNSSLLQSSPLPFHSLPYTNLNFNHDHGHEYQPQPDVLPRNLLPPLSASQISPTVSPV
jgi:hypothetical protein